MPLELNGICTLLQVFDMPKSLQFYRDVLEFGIVSSSAPPPDCDWIWLRRGNIELMLNTAYEKEYRPAAPDRDRVLAHDDTCLYVGCPDVDAAYEYLKACGVAARPPKVAPYGMKQLYLKDPDGYGICFQWEAASE